MAHSNLGVAFTLVPEAAASREKAIFHLTKAIETSPENKQVSANLAAFYTKEALKLLSEKKEDLAIERFEIFMRRSEA